VVKFLIAVVFLLGLTHGKSDAVDLDGKDRVSVEFRVCKNMPWKGKGVKKKKLNCFMDLARKLESGGSEAFIACKKKHFIREKKNCFRDLVLLMGLDKEAQ
jgi:hypothetical protein